MNPYEEYVKKQAMARSRELMNGGGEISLEDQKYVSGVATRHARRVLSAQGESPLIASEPDVRAHVAGMDMHFNNTALAPAEGTVRQGIHGALAEISPQLSRDLKPATAVAGALTSAAMAVGRSPALHSAAGAVGRGVGQGVSSLIRRVSRGR